MDTQFNDSYFYNEGVDAAHDDYNAGVCKEQYMNGLDPFNRGYSDTMNGIRLWNIIDGDVNF